MQKKKFQIVINQYLRGFDLFLNLTINGVVDRCSNTVKAEMLNSDLQSSRKLSNSLKDNFDGRLQEFRSEFTCKKSFFMTDWHLNSL